MMNWDRLANYLGTHVLSFQNPRVVCPPGHVVSNGRQNIVVASPRRSGTHVMIDILLNSFKPYRRRPLYVDLDRLLDRPETWRADLTALEPGAGYVVKSHYPIGCEESAAADATVRRVAGAGIVICLERPMAEIVASERRWSAATGGHGGNVDPAAVEAEIRRFWAFWEELPHTRVRFADLFCPAALPPALAVLPGGAATRLRTPGPGGSRTSIYVNKGLTRLLGARAPRIDTSIYTLKK